MKITKKIFKNVVIWWSFVYLLAVIWGNVFVFFLLIDKPEILHGVSVFLIFSLIVQILFFIDIFSEKNRQKQGFIKTVIIMWVLLTIFMIGMLCFIYGTQWFINFIHNDSKVMILLPSAFMLVFLFIDFVICVALSIWFFSLADSIEKKKTHEEILKLIK